jgi:hypothetical protein
MAPALQRALHGFAKPWYRPRALSIFRDKTSLAANPALWPAIESALGKSLWFLYLASPRAAESPWVQKEIQWWLEHRSGDKMLVLLTEGELAWDGGAGDFDWGRTSAVPRSLGGRFKDEPLYVDLRWARGDETLSLRHSRFRAAILDIAAPLHGKPKEDLDGDDVRQHRRNKAWAWSAAAALALSAVAAVASAVYAVSQRDEAVSQRNEAVAQRDRAIARQIRSDVQRIAGIDDQWTVATLLMIESLRRNEDAASYEALWKLVRAGAKPVARFTSTANARVAFSPDGRRLACSGDEAVVVGEVVGSREIARIKVSGGIGAIAWSSTGDRVLVAGEMGVRVFDVAGQREVLRLDDRSRPAHFGLSRDGQFIAIASGRKVTLFDAFAGRVLFSDEYAAEPTGTFSANRGKWLG